MTLPTLTARYTRQTKTRPAVVIIYRGVRADLNSRVSEHVVSGRAEARKIAAQYGAHPWNF